MPPLMWAASAMIVLIVLPVTVPSDVEMLWVPTSISVFTGMDATIQCKFQNKTNEKATIEWLLIQRVLRTNNKTYIETEQQDLPDYAQMKELKLSNIQKSDRGLYKCKVTVKGKTYNSCGTYLRVKEPPFFIFFNIAEATKNRVITAEGVILLLCAVIPGTFLLYRRHQRAQGRHHIWEAYFPSGKARNNDYTSLTAVELLAVQGALLET
ncbi:B-cell antigen receptor complex-associated protein alpha chain isoform X2 [Pseudophryne corroboree]|uniref:B-cell antigen receptor complex-associated protein alpha chain isoform X2 n=1 Tax=Pseudophryne corroboree TaxID=495146 RepID=UPI003081BBC5